MNMEQYKKKAVENLIEYLRIKSVHPNVDYGECLKFLEKQAASLSLPFKVYEVYPEKPVVVISFVGENPELPSILLNSHMDVVPVYEELWSYPPFAAVKDENGNIYARGVQDMKSVGIAYIETIRRFINEGLRFKRTIHVSFVPDEEIGGKNGMGLFVNTDAFKDLNIGFAFDEGIANPDESFLIFYAERSIWHLKVICNGQPGHGSILHEGTAGEKALYVINKFMEFRSGECQKLKNNPNLTTGDVTTINVTMFSGGVQTNVVPPQLTVTFDVRVAIDQDHEKLEKQFNEWCKEAGDGTYVCFEHKDSYVPPTKLDSSNPWWIAFKEECDRMNLEMKAGIFQGGTDARFLREKGIPAIGFSPINNTPARLHDNDEYLNENVFCKGLDIYYNVIKRLASLEIGS